MTDVYNTACLSQSIHFLNALKINESTAGADASVEALKLKRHKATTRLLDRIYGVILVSKLG